MGTKPILFNSEMVRAILDGRKTQTRRVIKPQPRSNPNQIKLYGTDGKWRARYDLQIAEGKGYEWNCPYGVVGDRLWVRESNLWKSECGKYYARNYKQGWDIFTVDGKKSWLDGRYEPTGFDDKDHRFLYPEYPHMYTGYSNKGRTLRSGRFIHEFELSFADLDVKKRIEPLTGNTIIKSYEAYFKKHVPSIHMPKWAARLWLEITGIKVERAQDISEEDCMAEGMLSEGTDLGNGSCADSPYEQFAQLWDSINAKRGYGWEVNPHVWVLEFRKVK